MSTTWKSINNGPYRKVVQEDDHALLVLEDERVDDLHVGLLDPELDEVGQVLEALGDHHQGAGGRGRRRVGDQVELE